MPNVGRQYAQKQQAAKKKKKKPGAIKSFLQKRKHKKTMKKLGFGPSKASKQLKKSEKKADKFKKKGSTKLTQRGRQKEIGASKGTKVSRGAKSVEKTKGGEYVKYAKESRAGGSFKKTFANKCGNGASGFTWQGRKYSCAKKASAPKPGSKKFIGPTKKKRTNTGISKTRTKAPI